MTYHLKNWEYFIEVSCFVPSAMIKILSDALETLGIIVNSTAFSRIVDSSKCVRSRGGLETVILLTLDDYIGPRLEGDPLIFDNILKILDEEIGILKESWADNHIII